VLAEVTVDGIERGELSVNFETGPGGPAELMVRVVGERGARASIEHVTIGPPAEATVADRPIFRSANDLALAPGDGLRVDADFAPRLLPAAAEMLREAIEDATGRPAGRVASTVTVSVAQPEATDWPARESYHLAVSTDGVTIEAPAEHGAFWGMMTLIDLIRPEPDGGARILAVDVTDGPALPWRIGVDQSLIVGEDAINGARRLARLKLNMGLVASGPPQSEQAAEAMRDHGVEPVAFVPDYPDSHDVPADLRDAVERLAARHVLLSYWYRGALDWESEPLATALALAQDGAAEVIVLLEETGPPSGPAPGRALEVLSQAVGQWPTDIVLAMPSGPPPEAQAELGGTLGARGISWVADGSGRDAMGDLLAQPGCVGVIVVGADLSAGADLAWRALPEDVR